MHRFGLRVRELRALSGLSQEELAELVELSPRQMQRIEAGLANVGLQKIAELAHELRVPESELFRSPSTKVTRRPGRPVRQKE